MQSSVIHFWLEIFHFIFLSLFPPPPALNSIRSSFALPFPHTCLRKYAPLHTPVWAKYSLSCLREGRPGTDPSPHCCPGLEPLFSGSYVTSFLMTFSLNIKLLYKLLWSCVNHCDLRQSIHLLSWSFPSVNEAWPGLSWASLGISSFC